MTHAQRTQDYRHPAHAFVDWSGWSAPRWYLRWQLRAVEHHLAHLQSVLDQELGSTDLAPLLTEYANLVRERNVLRRRVDAN